MEDNSNDDVSITHQQIEAPYLEVLKRMNALILSLMRQKYFTNFLRKDL